MENIDQNKVIDYLQQVEVLSEDVLADRSEIVELNKKRDKYQKNYSYHCER
jgi:hypothetical protein